MVPEFLLLGLLQEAVVPTGFPWICWVTVWRIMSRSCWVRVMLDSKPSPRNCASAAELARAAMVRTSGLIDIDMLALSRAPALG